MTEAKKLIEEVLESKYHRENFKRLISNIFKQPIIDLDTMINLSEKEKEYFESASLISDLKTSDGKDVSIIEVEVKKPTGITKPRYYQRDFIAKYLKNTTLKDGALVAFYLKDDPDWRFSFVKMDYSYKNGKPHAEKSPAVRYTYLVGENEPSHTAKAQLLSLLESDSVSLQSILDSFSIEKVGKEFFKSYEQLYKKLLENLRKNKTFQEQSASYELIPENFAKKLLGRIVFLYFIQKKGWLGVPKGKDWGYGDKNFLYNLYLEVTGKADNIKYLKNPEGYGNYYNDVLEHLFYDALNKQNLNSVSRDFHPYFNSKIPFLNGGLFEREYNWKDSKIFIENDIFEEILETFNRYNFTVKEEDPLDKDIAVDPEMLGKIFENLLAQEERKSRGSFYTPRPIVYYMVKESLFYYLKEHLKEIPDQDLRALIDGNIDGWNTLPPDSIFDNAEKIDKLLEDIKVVDPAVGSGAFIVSMLQEIAHMRIILSFYIDSDKQDRTEYRFKKHAIENSIYGVDIDPGAVDIAKLRLWLSLVVEHEIDEIEPLPNLDYKIICGNSLIEDLIIGDTVISFNPPKADAVLMKNDIRGILKKLEDKKSEYFNTFNEKRKAEISFEIEELTNEYINSIIKEKEEKLASDIRGIRNRFKGHPIPKAEAKKLGKLAEDLDHIKNIRKTLKENCGFFPWRFKFSEVFEKGGFDIVIGNPPYVRADKAGISEQRDIIKKSKKYKTLWEKWDLYIAFIEKGFELLAQGGILELIIPDAYLTSKYAKKSHDFFIKNAVINRINFCSDIKIFEAGVRNIIIEFKKEINPNNIPLKIMHKNTWENQVILPSKTQSEMGENTFRIESENKFFGNTRNTLKWGEICYVSVGMVLNADEKIAKGEFTKSDLISEKKDEIHSKKYVEAKWIDKYVIKRTKYLEWGTERVPNKIRRPTFKELYLPPKIMKGRMTGAVYDKTALLCNDSIIISVLWKDLKNVNNRSIKGSIKKDFKVEEINQIRNLLENNSEKFSLKYLLAILNSKWAYKFMDSNRRSRLSFYPDDLKKLLIKITSKEQQKPFENLVDIIIEKKQRGEDTTNEEFQIDLLVYKLYNLTYDELKIIDPEIEKKITREEWERFEG